mmetsp:Transcript_7695/g.12978  ORF Transcript_7695/g.12978 Transcript_7695/m.12978 type:complete len:298 (-) Transcript_7695:299-1192(-)
MARTMQTARKSTGFRNHREYETSQESLFRIYEKDKTRSIAVNGSDDLKIQPDLVKLFFEISEVSQDVTNAIELTLQKLGAVRDKIVALGVANDCIFSDSITVNNAESMSDDEEEEDEDVNGEKSESSHEATVVCRVQLEGETAALFGKVMFAMSSLGVQCHQAPLYESTELTAHRNESRENAIRNAKEKASRMVDALNNESLQLGKPISIIDTHVNVDDDADESFVGNFFTYWSRRGTKRKRTHITQRAESKSKSSQPTLTRLDLSGEAQARMDELFVVPPIIIRSFVQVVFEIEEV